MTKFEIPKSEGTPNVGNGEKRLTMRMAFFVGVLAKKALGMVQKPIRALDFLPDFTGQQWDDANNQVLLLINGSA